MIHSRMEDEMYQVIMRFLWECREVFAETYDNASQNAIEVCIVSLSKARGMEK